MAATDIFGIMFEYNVTSHTDNLNVSQTSKLMQAHNHHSIIRFLCRLSVAGGGEAGANPS